MHERSFELVPLVHHVSPTDSFKAERIGDYNNWWSLSAAPPATRLLINIQQPITCPPLPNFKLYSHDSCSTFRVIFLPVCELLTEGVAAIFGPATMETSGIVASIAEAVEMPHITAHWEREPFGAKRQPNQMTLNIYPDTEVLSRAFAELLIDYTWKSYTIIYEDDDGLMRLKDILQIHDPQSSPITVRCVTVSQTFFFIE